MYRHMEVMLESDFLPLCSHLASELVTLPSSLLLRNIHTTTNTHTRMHSAVKPIAAADDKWPHFPGADRPSEGLTCASSSGCDLIG